MRFFLKHRIAFALVVALGLPVLAQFALAVPIHAQTPPATGAPACDPLNNGGQPCKAPVLVPNVEALIKKVTEIVNILFTALLLLAVVFVILAAFDYLTAGGDAEKVKKASKRVLYAAVAVAVAVAARAVPIVVQSILT